MSALYPVPAPARAFVLSLLLLLAGLPALAEGTKQVMPSSTNGVGLYVNTSTGVGPYLNASSDDRVRFYINNANERFYFGVKAYNRSGPTEVTGQIYFRILTAAGAVISGPTALSNTAGSAGHIDNYTQAVNGPSTFTAGGYTPRVSPALAVGEYYIELYESTDGGTTATSQQTIFTYFDFTVANPTLGAGLQVQSGRVWSQAWSFITYNTGTNAGDQTVPMQSVLYGYTNDQTVSRITFNSGFKPLAAVIAFNKYGAVYNASGSEWYASRRSQNTGGTAPSLREGYKIFLSSPASIPLFARAAAPSTPSINSITGCPGSYTISYTLFGPGDVALLIDLNGTEGYQVGTTDRILNDTSKVAGTYTLPWDGKDGLGNTVSAATAKMTLYHRIGRINLPIYDAEINTNGFSVAGLEPIAYTPRLYWNDTLLASVGGTCTTNSDQNAVNATGKGVDSSAYGMAQINYLTFGFVGRAWNGSGNTGRVPAPTNGLGDATTQLCDDYGNIRTLNTWWWSGELNSAQNNYNLPDCRYIAGTVYNDVNGGTINGTAISAASGTQLYVYVANTATGRVVAKQTLTDGNFAFGAIDGVNTTTTTYQLVLSTVNAAVNDLTPAATLPTAWVNTAEGPRSGSGDASANGVYTIGSAITTYTYFDFGLDALPTTTVLGTATTQQNPGGTNTVTIPAATFSGTDADAANGGTISYIRIVSFPSNATSVTVTGATTIGGAVSTVTYTSGTFPAGGVYVATNGTGNPATNVLVDPANGAVTVDISYRVVDNAGKESLASGVARQPLSDLSISGNVYDDPDAGVINGTLLSSAGGQLYVNLVSGGAVVASKQVSSGAYSFTTADGLQNNVATYSLVLTNSAAATTSILPSANFTYTAEGVSGTTGDGTANGTFTFGANVVANTMIDFGVDALPTVSALNTATSQANPGGTATVTVPVTTFSGADAGDISGGQVEYIWLTSFPTNATSITVTASATIGGAVTTATYTSGNFPAGGLYIATNNAGNPSTSVIVDPANGAVNVDFSYRTIDNAGKASLATGIARQPLSDLSISGTVFNDADGSTDNIVDGTAISNAGGQLYVNLVNTATNTVVASRTLTNGTFSFGTADGLQNNVSTYVLVLASSASATTAALPTTGYVNTGEGLAGTVGDANANGRYQFGANVTSNTVINFGIDALPTPAALTTATQQVNPGGTITVTIPATTFSGTDAVDAGAAGQVKYIHITSFPSNTTTVNFAAASTTLGGTPTALSYTSGTFPAGGVYVASNTSGNPASAITVDPVSGTVNVDFVYTVVDQANQESITTGIARQPLADLTISGNIYDDVTAGVINGSLISSAGGQLYVNLINTQTNTVVASKAVTSGAYSFGTADGLRNDVSGYRLVLTSSAAATSATLPSTQWVYIAEGASGTTGDGAVNGTYNFASVVTTSTAIDFAIEALPVPAALTVAASVQNPGGTATVSIPAGTFVASDATDLAGGAVSYIRITSFPTNITTLNLGSASTSLAGPFAGASYTSATFPAGGIYVPTSANGSLAAAMTVDPVNGAVNVDITYTAIDNTGKESLTSGIARRPLTDLTIAGTVYDDANGTTDNSINGTAVGSLGGTQLYANLVSGGVVIANQAIPTAGPTAGTFSFTTANGITSGGSYTVVISAMAPASAASLPAGWVNTAEGITAAGDGAANGSVTLSNVTTSQALLYGVNATPTATSATTTALANPGGTTFITVPSASFPGTDPDTNGEIAYVRLTAFPTGVTSMTVYAATTFGGTATTVTYTSGNFPAGGLYIPTDGPGNLLPVDALRIDPVDGATQATFAFTVYDIAGYQSNAAVTTIPFISGAISGTVYNDFNALTDNTINGVGTNLSGAPYNAQLYVYAIDGTNTVAGKATVGADGTYVISGLGSGNYTLLLTSANVAIGAPTPAQTLPSGWIFTGEGLVPSGDGAAPNGQIAIALTSDGIANADFGIDARPVANNTTAPSQVNPGGVNNITVPATSFSGTDADAANGGEIEYVRITAFPTNATSVTITGSTTPGGAVSTVTYTSGTFPNGTGVYVATNDNGSLVTANAVQVDPINGSNSIVITYTVRDNAGQESTTSATLTQPLTDLLISGNVFNDVNAGIISGTGISATSVPLFVNLVNTSNNTVVASQDLSLTGGSFSFGTANNVQNNVAYSLVVTNSATATASAIGTGWTYTAEGLTGTTGDGTANGLYTFAGNVTTSQAVDFGLDALPTAAANTAVTLANPGSTTLVTVPATTFSGTDADAANGGIISYVRLTAFPSNATSITVIGSTTLGGTVSTLTYTSSNFPGTGIYIATAANGNPANASAVRVDPVNGAVTVVFPYKVIDNAGKESTATANASQPFSDVLITGSVYDDANGTTDGFINGSLISSAGGQLYVNLVDVQSNTVVASKALTNGTFSFGTANGVRIDVATYQLVLATSATATTSDLPGTAWVNTAEGLSGSAGDALPDGRFVFNGNVTTSVAVDFGIDALPVPAIITTAVTQVNPGGTNTVTIPASTFVASDATDLSGGEVDYIRIISFPANATTITFANAATTVNGTYGPLSYTSATFPAGGVYVATAANGNPGSAISVDPVAGAVTVDVVFHAIDNAGQESLVTGTARQPLSDLTITGTVYDDVDGGTIDGTPIASASGQLYVNLVSGGNVVASKAVSATSPGFSFGTADNLRNDVTDYSLVLTTSATATTAALPTIGWVNTAEGLSAGSGDGTANGTYAFGGAIAANTVIDFGVDARPIAVPLTVATPKVNPGGAIFIPIANNLPLAVDPVDVSGGQVSRLRVVSFPTDINAVTVIASETLNGPLVRTTYTAATFPAGGVYVATNASGSTLDSFYVDPINGADTVVIEFRAIDQAGVESNNIGIGKIPITELTISGNVYNDVNGNTDGILNGTPISNAGGQLYVNLIDGTNTVIASKAVTNGTFSFSTTDGLRSDVTTYRLVLTASAAATAQGLPDAINWVNTAEGLAGSPDGLANGRFTISSAVTAPIAVDFGIEARPATTALTVAPSQLNPGGTATLTIPAVTFSGTDVRDIAGGQINYIRITGFPTGAASITLTGATTPGGATSTVTYTAGTFPTGGIYVATNTSGNPLTAITVDPLEATTTVDVPYATIDNAGYESPATGIARQPLNTLSITGNVYDDYNGLTDALINGAGTNAGGQLYVNALDAANNVLGSALVAANGTYTITGLSAGTYTVVLTNSMLSATAALPAGYVNTAEGAGTASDGGINGATTVVLANADITDINFGVNQIPVADDKNYVMNQFTSPLVINDARTSTLNPAVSYAYRIGMSGMLSGGATPGSPTALDPDGNNGAPLTLSAGTPDVRVVIDPASYIGIVNGTQTSNAIVLLYDGVQLQPGGCQGSDIGNGVCNYYNNVSGKWEIPMFDLSKLNVLAANGTTSLSFEYAFKDAAGFTGTPASYQMLFSTPLPVHLITFTGVKRGNTAVLNWTVDNETDFRGYGVERSVDGRNFEQVGFVNARNVPSLQQYGFNDDLSSIRSARVYYRLKQLDNNGSFTYSNVVNFALTNGAVENAVTVLINPVRNAVKLQVRSGAEGKAEVLIVDASGRVIATRTQQVPQGTTTFNVEVPGFAANGIYTVVTVLNGERFANKILLDR